MADATERRAVALQEAVKVYTLQYGAAAAKQIAEDFSMPDTTNAPDDILKLADRFDDFLYNGELGIKDPDED